MTYKRINKQTGEVKVGPWGAVADLDVRLWTRPEEIVVFMGKVPMTRREASVEPLCEVRVQIRPNTVVWHGIYRQQDLASLYIIN